MRVTQSMISNNMMKNINSSLKRLDTSYNQMSTGKKFQKPSDDPMGFIASMDATDSLTEVDQYRSNCNTTISWMNSSDSALNQFTTVLHRLEEIGVGASNSTLSQTSCNAYADEVAELRDYVLQITNTKYGDRYLFAGQKVDTKAYDTDASGKITYQGSNTALSIQIGDGSKIEYSYPGNQIFEYDSDGDGTNDKSIFEFMSDMENSIRNMDFSAVSDSLEDIGTILDNVLNIQASYGAKVKRLSMNVSRLDELKTQFKSIRSEAEDVNASDVAIEYKTQQTIYEAALAAGAKVIQTSLMKYI